MMKRTLDIVLASLILVLFFPFLCIIAVLIRILMGPPVFFVQTRPGWKERPFRMFKFRTMTDARQENGKLLADEHRLPTFGRFLRAASLDELPELWNVLRGEMSLVGPRPLLMEYLPLYNSEQRRRHEVLPGITGWTQIKGRNDLSWDEKFRLDNWYVDNQSFWLDLKILAITFIKVIQREGISKEGHATTDYFSGNK